MITHIRSVSIVVGDYDRASKFYRDALGFEVTADVTDPKSSQDRWLTLKPRSGQTELMLVKTSLLDESSRLGKSTHMVLDTDDIQAECEHLKLHGAQVLHEPKRAGWGNAIETHFADPDGNIFLLVQPTD